MVINQEILCTPTSLRLHFSKLLNLWNKVWRSDQPCRSTWLHMHGNRTFSALCLMLRLLCLCIQSDTHCCCSAAVLQVFHLACMDISLNTCIISCEVPPCSVWSTRHGGLRSSQEQDVQKRKWGKGWEDRNEEWELKDSKEGWGQSNLFYTNRQPHWHHSHISNQLLNIAVIK